MLIALRNFLIIALMALVLTVAPGGGNFTDALLTTLSLIFMAAIGLLLVRTWKETSFTRDSMEERSRTMFYIAIGAIALMIAGIDELFATGPGTIVWLAVVGGAGYVLFMTWREANSY